MENFASLISTLTEKIAKTKTLEQLEALRVEYLGRAGYLNTYVKTLKKDDLKKLGREINETKNKITQLLEEGIGSIQKSTASQKIDVTIPGTKPKIGHLHLMTQTINEIDDIFKKLGFARRRYPEVETDWYYAEGLNIPKDHPARDDQETFYVSDDTVLTAHTSNGQLREMELVKTPPIKMLNLGKTYRRQADASHNPMFHQFEGLVIDEGINITHLIGVLDFFVKNYFSADREIRLRPHHFQFTEPSFEIDITCDLCHGTGKVEDKRCRVCKAGWLELGGAGMVHPNVLKNGHIDPEKYTGFAFGWGVERVMMMKHHFTDDLRDIYSTNLKFLNQF